jgi:DNA-binding Lrp family transcriptional regulator
MDELLRLLKENAKESPENLAKMLGIGADEVRTQIEGYENSGIIRGYQAIVDEDQLDTNLVTAVIEVKILPEREGGFDRVARRISRFDEVQSMYLMSGAYDLLLFVAGNDLKKVASFVSEKLSTLDGVTSTATHFMLKTYKHHGVTMDTKDDPEKLQISP